MAAVIIALVAGVFAGALVVWLVMRGQGQQNPAVLQSQGEIKARLDEALAQVQRLGAIFANAGQRGRAGELVLENLLEATGMDRHRDFELQMGVEDGSRPDVVLTLAGRASWSSTRSSRWMSSAGRPPPKPSPSGGGPWPLTPRRSPGTSPCWPIGTTRPRSRTPSTSRCASCPPKISSPRRTPSVPNCSTTRCGSGS